MAWEFGRAEDGKMPMTYSYLKESALDGTNWCRKSKVTGQVPSWILSEIRGKQIDDVPSVYNDTGRVNFVAGVWRVREIVRDDYGTVEYGNIQLQPFRVTGGYYHNRIGANA